MRRSLVLVCVVALAWLLNFAIAHASTDGLVISEVQAGLSGTGNSTKEFIELYNPTSQNIDLKGYRLVKRAKSSTSDTSIKSWSSSAVVPAKSFYLWVHNDYPDLLSSADAHTGSAGIGYISNDNAIALRLGVENTGQIIDAIAWGNNQSGLTANIFSTNIPDGKSLERIGYSGDFAIQDNPTPKGTVAGPTEVVSTPTENSTPPSDQTPAPETSNTPPTPTYSTDIVISELLPNPDGRDDGEEWVELYNRSQAPVDLSGWILDDAPDSVLLGKDAYTIPDGTSIGSGQYLAVDLPVEAFTLNNTGGDMVRLFWPNKTLTASAQYSDNAKEDLSFALRPDNTYAWTTFVTKGTANQFADQLAQVVSAAQQAIKINEIFPNPKGPDAGLEWIEVRNAGAEPVYLHNWIVDDGVAGSQIGASAYKLQSPTVYPGGLAVIMIPSGKFSLNNTGSETVRLFNENKTLIDSVTYADAKEDLSYAFLDGKWIWATPTPNAENTEVAEQKDTQVIPVDVEISEVFPEPARKSGQEEFIELYNAEDTPTDLSGFKLSDAATDYKLPAIKLQAGEYLVIYKSESKISLNNTGKESVTLTDANGLVISSLQYEDAPVGQSYNLTEDGTYVWSSKPTPGAANEIKHDKTVAVTRKLPKVSQPTSSSSQTAPPKNIWPQVSGAGLSTPAPAAPQTFWFVRYWLYLLVGSFALNLAFCYILVKLMGKGRV